MLEYLKNFYNILVHDEDGMRRIDLMAGILIGISPIVHLLIVSGIHAPYGRYTSSSWGLPINARLAWFIQELPAFFIPVYLYMTTDTSQLSLAASILIFAFMVHYGNRTFIYSLSINGGKPTPVIIFFFASFFCICNGYMQAKSVLHFSDYKQEYVLEWNFVIGLFLFCFGFYTNVTSDSILRNLRQPGSMGYKIPHGGMFEYVTAANLWGEAVEWVGWALATWTVQGLAYAVFAVMYLSARSHSHHVWYIKKFDDYPKNRKIFIPFLL